MHAAVVSFITFVIFTQWAVLATNDESCPAFKDNSGDKIDCTAEKGKLILIKTKEKANEN